MAEKLKVSAPFDRSLIGEVNLHDAATMEKYLDTARQLSEIKNCVLPAYKRIEILEKTANLVEQRQEDYARQAAREGGKPLIDSRIELQRAAQGIREAAKSLSQLTGREIPMGLTPASQKRLAFTLREPIGVVMAVSAFNHPFNLIVHQVIPAVAVGCPVLVKPARTTPFSCMNLVHTLYEAGLPEDWCRAVICDTQQAGNLITDPRIAFLSFIGSGQVGWSLRARLAPGTRCSLEHGGVAPVIVEADADLQDALPLLAKGGFYHAGQVCVSVQRVYAHEKIADALTDGLVKLANKMVVGNPLDEKTEVGPLISEAEVDRVHAWVQEAQAQGARILSGGKKIGASCYAPTVILNPPGTARVSREEVFGPVICVYPYARREEAIARANSVPFSFQAAVFTKNIDVALDTAKRLEAASVMINDHTAFRVDWMPFAGHKQSGLGVGGILPAMLELTKEKLVVFRSHAI